MEDKLTEPIKNNKYENIVFIQTNINLNSTSAFSQYIFQGFRLVTMIGELHDHIWECKSPNISIPEYCVNTVNNNPKCRVMLEYNSGSDPNQIGSETIKNTYKALVDIQRTNVIFPFDFRSYFLGSKYQEILYNSSLNSMTIEEIKQNFITIPFFDKLKQEPYLFQLQEQLYERRHLEYMQKTYMNDIYQHFQHIISNLNVLTINEIHIMLKDVWKKVADFFILREILQNTHNVNEYIILLGMAHFNNLDIVLKGITERVSYHTGGGPDNCIKLYEPYVFT